MADSYVTSTATLSCPFGSKKVKLNVLPTRTVFLTGKPMANISDHIPGVNIPGFGKCRSLAYPPTAAATAANHGKLTPMPCMPGTNSDWIAGKSDYIIKGKPALLKSSKCICQWGGVITVTDDGQTNTGPADLSKESLVKAEEMQAETQEKNKLDPDSVLDGIQFALDAAGMIPVAGAIPDLMNAAISAARGNWLEAGMSLLAAVPVIGDASGAAKIAVKGAKMAKKAKNAKVTVKQLSKTTKQGKPVIANEARKTAKREVLELEPGKKGSWNKELNKEPLPNTDYKVGKAVYKTDETGKVRQVKTKIELGTSDRNKHQQRISVELKDGKKGIDQGGHLIANMFKGAGEQINYVPMLGKELNQGQWKKMELEWQKALKKEPPANVETEINVLYKAGSKRPLGFLVNYTIDGVPYRKKFRNFTFEQ